MVSLHGFSILILLTQSNHKSALLFSCTKPLFRCMRVLYNLFSKKSNICSYILGKIKKIFRSYPQYGRGTGRNIEQKQAAALQRKPARRERKRRSASGSARTPFRGGPFCRCVFFCSARLSGCVSVVFRRELVCGGAKRRRTRL